MAIVFRNQSKIQNPKSKICAGLRGLTLVEVMMSTAILAFGAVLVSQALARISYAQAVGERYDQAYIFAATKMADLEVALRAEQPLDEHEGGSFRVGSQMYRWDLTAAPVLDSEALTSIVLTVSWRYASRDYQRRFETVWSGLPIEEG